jgi:hypothetical protein
MPYSYKKEGDKYCVYRKDTGKKVGCTTKDKLKKYLAALHFHANEKDSKTEQLKEGIRKLIYEVIEESENVIMRTKVENDNIENVLNKNVGIPFDDKEKQEVVFKQGELGIKSTIQRNGTEIKFSTSDMFGNNKINVIKKLKNMSDPNTLLYANFFTVIPTDNSAAEDKPEQSAQAPAPKPAEPTPQKPEEVKKDKVYIKLSQPFDERGSEKLDILGDFLQQIEIK